MQFLFGPRITHISDEHTSAHCKVRILSFCQYFAPNSHLWYWACRKWNSSLIRSQDSVTVNFNGCPGWRGTSTQTKQRV